MLGTVLQFVVSVVHELLSTRPGLRQVSADDIAAAAVRLYGEREARRLLGNQIDGLADAAQGVLDAFTPKGQC